MKKLSRFLDLLNKTIIISQYRMGGTGVYMVFERIRSVIAEQFTVNEKSIDMDTSFIDDLGADSLDAVDLTLAILSEFDIPDADEESIMEFVTVGDVVNYISNIYD